MTIQQAILGGSGFGLNWTESIGSPNISVASSIPDTQQNLYTLFTTSSAIPTIAKINPLGGVDWQKTLAGVYVYGGKIVWDAAGYLYITGLDSTSTYLSITKLDTSGALSWAKKFSLYFGPEGLAVDSSSNVFLAGSDSSTPYNGYILKLNSSGVLQWQRKMASANYAFIYACATDSIGDVYFGGSTNPTYKAGFISKYSSSGTFLWDKTITVPSPYQYIVYGITTDSANNVYVVGSINNATTDGIVVKFDANGTVQWQVQIQYAGSITNISYGSDGYLYVGGTLYQIIKMDTSGNVVFFNTLTTLQNTKIFAGAIGSMIGSGYSSATNSANTFNLPSNGGKLGTWTTGSQTYTYAAASSYSVSTPTLTYGSTGFTYSTPAGSLSSNSATVSTAAYTSNVTYI